jgi:hypothetical protein
MKDKTNKSVICYYFGNNYINIRVIRLKIGQFTWTHYPNSDPTSLLSYMYTLVLSGEQQYQFYSLWFDLTIAQIHHLPHSRLAR